MAGNEWYEKHQKDVAAALKKGRGAPRDQAVSCTLVRMKDGAYLLCAHVSAGKATALVKEARTAGGKVISAGRLYAGPDGPTFEVDEGDLTVKAKFAAAAAEVLGSPLSVVVIAAVPQAPPPPPPGSPVPDMAAVQAALAKLLPSVQQAVKDYPDRKTELLQPLAQVKQHIQAGQAAEARTVLMEIARRVKALAVAPVADGQAARPEPDPGAPRGPTADMAAVKAALAKLVPAVQQAVKNYPDRKAELLQPLARCQQHLKDNQAAEAKAILMEVARLVKSLAVAPESGQTTQEIPKETDAGPKAQEKPEVQGDSGSERETSESESSEQDEFKELYQGLLETVPGDLQRLRSVDPAAADKIKKVVDGAAAYAAKGNFQQAFNYLNRAAEVLAKTAGAGRVKDVAESIPVGTVEAMKAALSQAQSKWVKGLTVARGHLKPIQALLKDEFSSTAVGVANIVESYEKELLEELRAGEAMADKDGVAAAVRITLEKVKALRTETQGDAVFTYLEQNGVPVKAAFAAAFDEVDRLLVA